MSNTITEQVKALVTEALPQRLRACGYDDAAARCEQISGLDEAIDVVKRIRSPRVNENLAGALDSTAIALGRISFAEAAETSGHPAADPVSHLTEFIDDATGWLADAEEQA